MYRSAVHGVRGLAHSLGHRRVRVNGADQLFDRGFQAQRERGFRDELGGSEADHVHAEDFVIPFVGNDLHEPLIFARHLRAGEHPEGKRPDADVVATLPGLPLGQPHTADLRLAMARGRS